MSGFEDSWLSQKRFVLTAHTIPGYTGPFEAVRDFLIVNGVGSLETLEFPLDDRSPSKTLQKIWRDGILVHEKNWRRPNKPPWTYPLDVFWHPRSTPDVWIAFDVLTIAAAVRRSRHSSCTVVAWHVDFVPPEEQSLLGVPYQMLDRYGQANADLVVELSKDALLARAKLHSRTARSSMIVPMGISGELHRPKPEQFFEKRIMYLGSLDSRATAGMLNPIIQALYKSDPDTKFDIVGTGPERESLLKLRKSVPTLRVHGYLSDSEAHGLLKRSTVGLAPYSARESSFSKFADPGKVKMYLAAGVPILITAVPPNAQELAEAGAALIIQSAEDPDAWAEKVNLLVKDEIQWRRMSDAAHRYAKQFTWGNIMTNFFTNLRKIAESKNSIRYG